jgi:GTPase
VVSLGEGRTFVLADVPGLIEGASSGAGLGHRFLRHLERTRVLIHLIELSSDPGRDPLRDYDAIRGELARYGEGLASRPEVVALNKVDLTEIRERRVEIQEAFAARGITLHTASAATGEGLTEILEAAYGHLGRAG